MNLQNFRVAFMGDPTASDARPLASYRQAGKIRAVANEKRVFANPLCQRALGCRADELNSKAASAFIDALMQLEPIQAGTFWQVWKTINS